MCVSTNVFIDTMRTRTLIVSLEVISSAPQDSIKYNWHLLVRWWCAKNKCRAKEKVVIQFIFEYRQPQKNNTNKVYTNWLRKLCINSWIRHIVDVMVMVMLTIFMVSVFFCIIAIGLRPLTDTQLIVAIVNNNYLILRHIVSVSKYWSATKTQLFACLFFFLIYSIGQSIGDSRCYLDGGGSAESLTASEDLSVGSAIGKYIPD